MQLSSNTYGFESSRIKCADAQQETQLPDRSGLEKADSIFYATIPYWWQWLLCSLFGTAWNK